MLVWCGALTLKSKARCPAASSAPLFPTRLCVGRAPLDAKMFAAFNTRRVNDFVYPTTGESVHDPAVTGEESLVRWMSVPLWNDVWETSTRAPDGERRTLRLFALSLLFHAPKAFVRQRGFAQLPLAMVRSNGAWRDDVDKQRARGSITWWARFHVFEATRAVPVHLSQCCRCPTSVVMSLAMICAAPGLKSRCSKSQSDDTHRLVPQRLSLFSFALSAPCTVCWQVCCWWATS